MFTKRLLIEEVHIDRTDPHGGPGDLDIETQCQSIVGLDTDNQHIVSWPGRGTAGKIHVRGAPKLDGDLTDPAW